MEEIIAVILFGYVFNFLPGMLVMSNEKKRLFWLLIPYYFMYFLYKDLYK